MRVYFDFGIGVNMDKDEDGGKSTDVNFTIIPTVVFNYSNQDFMAGEHFKEREKWWSVGVRFSWLVFDFGVVLTSRPRRNFLEGAGK